MDAIPLEHYRFCPQHGCEMPCFACLIPDVVERISQSHMNDTKLNQPIWMLPVLEGMN